MENTLSLEAVRVLGVLIEKELSTPDYYPMTINALVNGCNQKSNPNPVVEYGEIAVINALDELNERRLSGHASMAGSRTAKYRHAATQHWGLTQGSVAVVASLMLRGAQTVGELRTHTSRMVSFSSMDEVAGVLESLCSAEQPLVRQIGKSAGQKGIRFAHLLSGEPTENERLDSEVGAGIDGSDRALRSASARSELEDLKERLTHLELEFEAFRKQFE